MIENIDLNKLFRNRRNEFQKGNFLGIEEHYQIDWDWDIPQYVIDMWMKEDGFIYKCIADNRSTRQQHMEFGFYAGRNIVERIFKCQPFGHLASPIIEIFYPESGLSPSDQARFVWMCTRHPEWHTVKELRIVTRSPFFVSDCKSPFCRVIKEDGYVSGVDGAEFRTIECKDKFSEKQRIHALRPDMEYAEKSMRLIFLWGAKKRRVIFYLGEDDNQVYYVEPEDMIDHVADTKDKKDSKLKVCRTTHYNMWYESNALWCNTLTANDLLEHSNSGKSMDDFMDRIILDLNIPKERMKADK